MCLLVFYPGKGYREKKRRVHPPNGRCATPLNVIVSTRMRLNDCPVRTAIDVIGGKWKPVILFHLMSGKRRHGELRKLMAEASQKMLTQQLRELERDGIVVRNIFPENPPRVEYELSRYGQTLQPVMRELCKWGKARAKLQ